ncbi:hypothetical protein BC830DRAFT_431946 [Chytriomyces sp. MP71]|nr:hypothetical protein BC830DRAFT_431946 [Chytriomyces sp. MP71]
MDLARPLPHTQLEPVELFALRHQVDEANRLRLAKIPGVSATYVAVDAGVSSAQVSKLTDACLAPSLLTLKAGVQVMLLKNLKDEILGEPEITSPELANGTIGIVVECFQECVQVDFSVPGGLTRRRTVTKEEWKIQDAFGNVLASRQQIPLMLSYAISIHKSQGQTLQLLRVDLGRVFGSFVRITVAISNLTMATDRDGTDLCSLVPSSEFGWIAGAEFPSVQSAGG